MPLFSGQVAVITGAGSGIGKAVAAALAAEGSSLCLVGRNKEKLDAVASGLQGAHSIIRSYSADLSLDADVHRLIREVKKDFGQVHILVHSAGDFSMGLIEKSPVADLDRQYRVNLRAPYLLTQGLLPTIRSCSGQIVFINSSVGLGARAKVSQYAATKHALKALADSLREEVNSEGIRVLSVFLGRTATPMQETVHKMEGKTYIPELFMRTEDVASAIIHALLMPGSAEVTDIHIRPMIKT